MKTVYTLLISIYPVQYTANCGGTVFKKRTEYKIKNSIY